MREAFNAVLETALKYNIDMRTAAYIVAINRVATVTKMRGMYAGSAGGAAPPAQLTTRKATSCVAFASPLVALSCTDAYRFPAAWSAAGSGDRAARSRPP